ncbi:hypothetical protein TcWFU_010088 [Taenia crassiceps]|uniref:NADH dehydrogenase [ubiquinone] 1 alpha subcomplex subunit 1 n=1 Tax=Taenia crassiceps TaxID=6207 RepID=A0ABR4QCJ3_9CEST
MWYEIIPSFAIMLGAAALMDPICKGCAYLLYRRRGDFSLFLRDRDVAGTHWRMQDNLWRSSNIMFRVALCLTQGLRSLLF